MFYSNLRFHRELFGLCGNDCLIETIEQLAQKVHVIRSYATADVADLKNARRDHAAMIEALQNAKR